MKHPFLPEVHRDVIFVCIEDYNRESKKRHSIDP